MAKREDLIDLIWDMYKDAHGVRPRGVNFDAMSEQDLEEMIAHLQTSIDVQIQTKRAAEADAIALFEQSITTLINSGAPDRQSAIRWLRTAYDDIRIIEDDSYFEYEYGLPFDYLKQHP